MMVLMSAGRTQDYARLAQCIRDWGRQLGFQQVGITGTSLPTDERHFLDWLAEGRHGDMAWMQRHGTKRTRPAELLPGTLRVISVRMNYLPATAVEPAHVLRQPQQGYIARYALGRDYHRVLRGRLKRLAGRIEDAAGAHGWRVYTDSAPVLEKALARNASLGWIGKHTVLIHPQAGSWFFLGEIYTDLPLPVDQPFAGDPCGGCQACIRVCPTGAITGPRRLDARRCISYLTIELRGPIPEPLRAPIGNRIFGCDDCQLVCPWNRHAQKTAEPEFEARHGLDAPSLVKLFAWSEIEFLRYTEGSALRRLGHERWLRNIAVALGNAPPSTAAITALNARLHHPSPVVREHVHWALLRQQQAHINPRSASEVVTSSPMTK